MSTRIHPADKETALSIPAKVPINSRLFHCGIDWTERLFQGHADLFDGLILQQRPSSYNLEPFPGTAAEGCEPGRSALSRGLQMDNPTPTCYCPGQFNQAFSQAQRAGNNEGKYHEYTP